MMNIRQRSVNVKRTELLAALKANLEVHRKEYAEALLDFKTVLLADLKAAVKLVNKVEPKDLHDFALDVQFPQNHEADYVDIIEMLEQSTDEMINIDSESFKAYYKNEWHWSGHFHATASAYKSGTMFLNAPAGGGPIGAARRG